MKTRTVIDCRVARKGEVMTHRELMEHANDVGITLNGKPALVRGCELPVAGFVHAIEQPAIAIEYSWQCIEHITNNGGNFRY